MRKTIAISILTTIACGLMGWMASAVTKIPVHEEKIQTIKIDVASMKKKIDDIHWYLLGRNK